MKPSMLFGQLPALSWLALAAVTPIGRFGATPLTGVNFATTGTFAAIGSLLVWRRIAINAVRARNPACPAVRRLALTGTVCMAVVLTFGLSFHATASHRVWSDGLPDFG